MGCDWANIRFWLNFNFASEVCTEKLYQTQQKDIKKKMKLSKEKKVTSG